VNKGLFTGTSHLGTGTAMRISGFELFPNIITYEHEVWFETLDSLAFAGVMRVCRNSSGGARGEPGAGVLPADARTTDLHRK
jgi:hypothetical protein